MREAKFSFDALVELCQQTHEHFQGTVAKTANMALAARNWLLGWYIVEYEQKGADRAQYGEELIARLAERLQPLGRGFSGRSLRQFRAFYQQRKKIWQTPSAGLLAGPNPMVSNAIEIWQTETQRRGARILRGQEIFTNTIIKPAILAECWYLYRKRYEKC